MTKLEGQQAGALIEEWDGPIYRMARRWLGNDADAADATQEIFLVLVRDLHQLRDPGKRGAWIMTVARRVLGRFKARRNQRRSSEDSGESREPSVDETPLAQRDRDLVIRDSVASLPAELREVIELHFFMGLTQREAAAALNLPRTTVQRRLERGCKQLKPRLTGAAAAAPDLGAWLRGPDLNPPSSLRSQLLNQLCEPTPTLATAVKGGIIMKIKTAAAVGLLAGLGVLGGAGAGTLHQAAKRARAPAASADEPTALALSDRAGRPGGAMEAAENEERVAALLREARALRARLTEAEAAIRAIEEVSAAGAGRSGSGPSAPARARDPIDYYAIAGELIDLLGEMERGPDEPGGDSEMRAARALRSRPALLQALARHPTELARALLERLDAGDPPLGPRLHVRCLDMAFEQPFDGPLSEAVIGHGRRIIEDPSYPRELRKRVVNGFVAAVRTENEAYAPAFFRALRGADEAVRDPEVKAELLKALRVVGGAAPGELLSLLRAPSARPALLRDALDLLPDDRLPELGEALDSLLTSEDAGLRAAALRRIEDLPKSAQMRRFLEVRLTGSESSAVLALDRALARHGDRQTQALLRAIARDPTRSEADRRAAVDAVDLIDLAFEREERRSR